MILGDHGLGLGPLGGGVALLPELGDDLQLAAVELVVLVEEGRVVVGVLLGLLWCLCQAGRRQAAVDGLAVRGDDDEHGDGVGGDAGIGVAAVGSFQLRHARRSREGDVLLQQPAGHALALVTIEGTPERVDLLL